jgi:methionyl-tRNA synthetase
MFYNYSYSIFGPQVWSPFGFGIFGSVFFLIVAIWFLFTIVLKGYALWHAAKLGQIWWFVALLIFNTLGILELVYIVFFLKKWPGKAEAVHHEHHAHEEHHEHHNHADDAHHDHTHHAA